MTVVARHARINGRIDVDGPLLVEGRIEGTIRATVITVAASGVVLAEIQAEVAEIHGVVIGNVLASERIEVLAGARVVGDLRAPEVALAAGATIEGKVDRAPPAAPEPTLDERPTLRARGPLRRPQRPGVMVADSGPAELPALAGDGAAPLSGGGPPRLPRLPSRARVTTRRGGRP